MHAYLKCKRCREPFAVGEGVNGQFCNRQCWDLYEPPPRVRDKPAEPVQPSVVKLMFSACESDSWTLWDWERFVIARARGKEEAYAKALKEYTTI